MVNFKAGDTVKRVSKWGDPTGLPAGEVGIVRVLHNTGLVEIEGYGGWLHNTASLELVTRGDELPPAPESVLYFNSTRDSSNDQRLVLEHHDMLQRHLALRVIPREGSTRAARSIGINLDADVALQLCHDLRRMAMEIKRKEKTPCEPS